MAHILCKCCGGIVGYPPELDGCICPSPEDIQALWDGQDLAGICSRCGKKDTMLMTSPWPDDQREYCMKCYTLLFPPGWTTDYQPLIDPEGKS